MADATVTALTTTLQNEITAGLATPASTLALSTGIVTGATTYAATVLARRVGLIATGINVGTYNGDDNIGKDASRYNECVSSDALLRSNISADSDLGQLRNGLPGLSTARINAIATAVVARATAYQAEFNQTLPS